MNWIHERICRSAGWRKTLESQVIPWALEGIEVGSDLLEVGSGPGLTTDILRTRTKQLTCIEIDPELANFLRNRMTQTNVTVIHGDATQMPFADQSYSAAVCFTMLHHVPSHALQNKLLAEVFRVLKKGGVFAGTDGRSSLMMRIIHIADTLTIINPETFAKRLEAIGFADVSVALSKERFRFRAKRPE